jgi:acetyl esterase/lipase
MVIQRLRSAYVFFLLVLALPLSAQELIPLWMDGKMPNSRGLILRDSIANERIYVVGTPKLRAFFPSLQENARGAVIICPGGGYVRLAHEISGTQLAKWFNTLGLAAFVLDYRLPNSPDLLKPEIGPLQDAQRAVRLVRSHSALWHIDPDKIGVLGTSAGGHLATTLGTHPEDVSAIGDSLDRMSFVPDFMVLVSPVVTMGKYTHAGSRKALLGESPSDGLVREYSNELHVTAATPPCFIVHAWNDKSVPQQNSLMFHAALIEKNVQSSFHVFPQGAHSIALRNNPGSAELWTTLCEAWLNEMGFLVRGNGK